MWSNGRQRFTTWRQPPRVAAHTTATHRRRIPPIPTPPPVSEIGEKFLGHCVRGGHSGIFRIPVGCTVLNILRRCWPAGRVAGCPYQSSFRAFWEWALHTTQCVRAQRALCVVCIVHLELCTLRHQAALSVNAAPHASPTTTTVHSIPNICISTQQFPYPPPVITPPMP